MIDNNKVFRFAVVGLATAALQYTLLYIGVDILLLNATLSSSATFVFIICFNYLMHYNWTFAVPAPHTKALSRYLIMTSCGFLINSFIMYAGTSFCQFNYLLVQTAAIGVIVVWNFSLSSLWVFKD